MSSKVDICNLALGYLGNSPIENIDIPAKSEEFTCKIWYDIIRKQALIDIKPNTANSRKLLPKLSEAPAFGYSSQYNLPNDCLFLYGIGNAEEKCYTDYILEENTIQTDYVSTESTATLPIRYVKDEQDTTKFTSDFVLYLALALAVELAYSINKDMNLKQMLEVQRLSRRDSLKNRQKQENKIILINNKRYLKARTQGSNITEYGKK